MEKTEKVSTKYGQEQIAHWLNTKEVAKLLGVTTRTIQNYRDQGMLPFSQIGRVIRYRSEDVQSFLLQHYVRPSNWEGGVS